MKKIVLSILTIVLITIGVKAQIPTAELVGHYDFSNGALTDNINSVSFTKTGTAATTITDRFGNANEAISLNGDDLLRPDIDFNLTSSNPYLARTVSFWVKTATNDGNVRLIYNDNDRTNVGAFNYKGLIVYLQNGQIKAANRVGSNGNLVTHSISVSDNVWHHITIQGYSTSISGTKRFFTYVFVDGAKEGGNGYQASTGSVTPIVNEHIGNLGFSRLKAASLSNTQKYLDGLDEVLFYTRVLTDPEVNSITNFAPCTVNIPDVNFKSYLVANGAINTNGDTEIQCSEASNFTGSIYCQNLSISDLTGIEAFTSLTQLYCYSNNLTSLDVSNNSILTHLFCNTNNLSSLDVSSNIALTQLNFGNNNVSTIDITNNISLTQLFCDNNNLNSLDISNHTALTRISCDHNNLISIDISNNTFLDRFYCQFNNLSSLDVNNNPNLISLYCDNNNISSLNLNNNTALIWLYCNNNNITNLDVSNNTALTRLYCYTNSLTSLNVANNNNNNITDMQAQGNSSLNCIQHDSGFNPNLNSNWIKDVTASWNDNCIPPCTINIPDANFKAYLVGNAAINTNGNAEIECSEASAYPGQINAGSLSISDLTGIEAFTNIIELNCNDNSLTSLDISQNTNLLILRSGNNSLTNLDISQNTALTFLETNSNSLTSLDLSQNVDLTDIYCLNNGLTNLDVSQNSDLLILNCSGNAINNIDVSQNLDLYYLFVSDNNLTSIDVSQNLDLDRLSCNGNSISTLDVSQNLELRRIDVKENTFNGDLDLSYNIDLDFINCSSNDLTSLNLANGNNSNVSFINISLNPNLNCVKVDDEAYSTANWTNIDAHTSFSNSCIVLVSSINIQGAGGVSSISSQSGTLQMEATVLPANADDATYTWSVNNTNASINSAGILTALADGTVEVTATANDASGITGTKMITISNQSVAINDISFENLSIYPNPTSGIVNLEIEDILSSIRLMDLTGKTVKVFNTESKQLDISEFNTGIYFLEIANAERKSVFKIIKK